LTGKGKVKIAADFESRQDCYLGRFRKGQDARYWWISMIPEADDVPYLYLFVMVLNFRHLGRSWFKFLKKDIYTWPWSYNTAAVLKKDR